MKAINARKYYERMKSDPDYRAKKYRNPSRDYAKLIKATTPCADCGIQYPFYVMQFDHVGVKKFTISDKSVSASLAAIKEEISQCDVVCANCHMERTYNSRKRNMHHIERVI